MRNPYLAVHALRRARRPAAGASGLLLQLVAAALAAPLAKPVLLGFLEQGAVPEGVEAIGFRLGALMVGAMSISTYGALVRGPDRAVLDPHPVQPRLLLDALVIQTAAANLALPAMAALLLAPVGLAGHWGAWAGATALVVGAWICGLGLGFAGSLGGVWAAYSPGLAAILDLLRGANPRMQAALIYAPAAVLGVGGLACAFAAAGLRAGLTGWAPGWAFLALPPVIGVVGLAVARPLAEVWYVRATALLAEIDGQWAGVENIAEQRVVYLEWAARGRRELVRALRQGWRRLRSWASGAWLLGGLGALAGWTGSPDAPDRVMVVVGGAVLLLGALPVRLAEGDPDWLDLSLGVPRGQVSRARAMAAWLYAQGAVIPAIAALTLRHGLGAAPRPLLALELLAAVGAGLGALAARHQGARGAWLYLPAAVLLWALVINTVSVGQVGGGP